MLRIVKLLLPALIPSWRFFDSITASPRIEFRSLVDPASSWQKFRPRPAHLSWQELLKRLFWNPTWNETLYLVSCCERILENHCAHSIAQIRTRIAQSVPIPPDTLQFRIVLVDRLESDLIRDVAFISTLEGP